jgi:hypothetical protein
MASAGRETCQPQCGHEESEQIHRRPGGGSQGFPQGIQGITRLIGQEAFRFFFGGVF